MKVMPEGLGIWISQLSQCESGDLYKVVERCKNSGIKWVCVKSGDGSLNPGFENAISVMTELLHTNGIKIYTWNYSKPSTWQREVDQISFLSKTGIDGHIITAELEWQTVSDNQNEAMSFLKALRNAVGDMFLGYSTFAVVNYHAKFPYAQFSEFCDASFPQLYWTEFNWDVQKAISMTDSAWNLFGINNPLFKKPVWPVAGAYGNEVAGVQGSFSPLDLIKFVTHYSPAPISLFSYDTASLIPNLTFDFLVARHGGFPLPIWEMTEEDLKPKRIFRESEKIHGTQDIPDVPLVGNYDMPTKPTLGDYVLRILKFLFHIKHK